MSDIIDQPPLSTRTQTYRYMALFGNLALLAWVAIWQLALSPHPHLSSTTLLSRGVSRYFYHCQAFLQASHTRTHGQTSS